VDTKLRVQEISEFRIYGRNKKVNTIINLLVPKRWREHAWHCFAELRARNDWFERHTRGPLEHIWIEKRRD